MMYENRYRKSILHMTAASDLRGRNLLSKRLDLSLPPPLFLPPDGTPPRNTMAFPTSPRCPPISSSRIDKTKDLQLVILLMILLKWILKNCLQIYGSI